MIYKRCSKCNRRIPTGTNCPHCKREYRKPTGTRKEYHTSRWRKLQAAVLAKYGYIDQYLLVKDGRIEPADTVHHIIPARENPGRFYDESNLIPLSRSSHDAIHAAYKSSEEEREGMQEFLQRIVRDKAE